MDTKEIKEAKREFSSDGVHLSLVPKPGGACVFIGKWKDWIKFIYHLKDTKKIKWAANYQGKYPRQIGVEMTPNQQENWEYIPLNFTDYDLCGFRYQRAIVDASIDSQIFSEIVAPVLGCWLSNWKDLSDNVLFFINEDDNEMNLPVWYEEAINENCDDQEYIEWRIEKE
jgi:hypothetical protein